AIYREVERRTAHSEIYFWDHVFPVADGCRTYAEHFLREGQEIDPVVCELIGLAHDIGYDEERDDDSDEHIRRGVIEARDLYGYFGITNPHLDRIIDGIYTHDGNLYRSRYIDDDGNIPLENIVANDVDAIALFEWDVDSVIGYLRDKLRVSDPVNALIAHAEKTFEIIYDPRFRKIGEPKYQEFLQNLKARL
ncbi:HD domain-containing protein, partial [Candidatus Pacearchaeota archaeon]|nr:HD domain-containing protein [Candidatus Pacearchaeota archaeon]MBD3283443.1 HD domain-containing protein [Candidatus Pacearchaeota archaeon]